MSRLVKVKRATTRKRNAESAWRNAIQEAVSEGESLRSIGEAAGVTHVRVLQIVRSEPASDWAYHAAHRKVESARGKPRRCSDCLTSDPDKIYEWASLTGDYANVMDYKRLCRTCHRRFDKARKILRGE
jgi:hypothetical protein